MKGYHVFVVGATRSGKTYWMNQLHRRWPVLSIYATPKNEAQLWGARARSATEIARLVATGYTKFVYVLPASREAAVEQLLQLQRWLYHHGREYPENSEPWAQLLVDECHLYSREAMDLDPLRTIATGGRHYGVRLVAGSQYPTAVDPTTRTNMTLVVFNPGIEGLQFLARRGYQAHIIRDWTLRPRHWLYYESVSITPALRYPV